MARSELVSIGVVFDRSLAGRDVYFAGLLILRAWRSLEPYDIDSRDPQGDFHIIAELSAPHAVVVPTGRVNGLTSRRAT